MSIVIREIKKADLNPATDIWNETVAAGIYFPQDQLLSPVEAKAFFNEQSFTGVALWNDIVVGLYILHPNSIGRCGHIANASYAVKENVRGNHIGEKLVRHSMETAAELSYRILQFNAVVATNKSAIHLYKKIGFKQIGVVPNAYRLDNGSYEDLISFYIDLTS